MKILSKISPQPNWGPQHTPHLSWGEYRVQIGVCIEAPHVTTAGRTMYESATIPDEYVGIAEPRLLTINGEAAWYWVDDQEG
jgi:hypothetical protein